MTAPPTVWFPPPGLPAIAGSPFITVGAGGQLLQGSKPWLGFGVNLDQYAILGVLDYNTSTSSWELDEALCDAFRAQLDNLVNAGCNVVRFHGLDICGGPENLFDPAGKQTTT